MRYHPIQGAIPCWAERSQLSKPLELDGPLLNGSAIDLLFLAWTLMLADCLGSSSSSSHPAISIMQKDSLFSRTSQRVASEQRITLNRYCAVCFLST